MAFTSERERYINVYVINADGSGEVNVTNSDSFNNFPVWSPTGSRILFSSTRDGVRQEIYAINADGSNLVRLTRNEQEDFQQTWWPDGDRISFVRFADGSNEVYVMAADGSGEVRLTKDDANEAQPLPFPVVPLPGTE
jgi:Tol biopolymer transport system component